MKRSLTLALALVAVAFVFGSTAKADVVAYWNFNDSTNLGGTSGCFQINPLGTTASPSEYSKDLGVASGAELSAWGVGDASEGNLAGPNGTSGAAGNQMCGFAGTTTNAQGADPAGGSLSILGNANSGHYFILEVDDPVTNGVLTYATRGTGTGYTLHTWEYSTDNGTNWTLLGSGASNQTATWSTTTVNLGNVLTGVGHESNMIRITVSGTAATNTNGNNRFDNILITGTVPEPGTLALLGLGCLGLIRRRR